MTDTNLRCLACEYSKWVDEELGLGDYKAKLSAGEPVVIFDFPRDQLSIKWLRQFYRGGFEVSLAIRGVAGVAGVLRLVLARGWT